jgi:drug/metabolite transporter (DMT)-like permease
METGVVTGIDLVIFITLIAALVTSFSQLLFKKGIKKRIAGIRDMLGLARSAPVVIGVFGYLLGLAIYLFALSKAPLSIVYPTFASTFVFVAIISFALLKERASAPRLAGVLVIFLGIFLVSLTI